MIALNPVFHSLVLRVPGMNGPHEGHDGLALLALIGLEAFSVVSGLFLLLAWKNHMIQTDDEGIREYDFSGKMTFQASWSELTTVSRLKPDSAFILVSIGTNDNELKIPWSVKNVAGLLTLIQARANHLDYSAWDYEWLRKGPTILKGN